MLKSLSTSVVVAALLCAGQGSASAEPQGLAPVLRSADPDVDGWHLTVSLDDLSINAVPNMAATPFTREGFITTTATLAIDGGSPASADLQSFKLQVWYQMGCQSDVSEGMTLSDNPHGFDVVRGEVDNRGGAAVGATPGGSDDPGLIASVNPGGIADEAKSGSIAEVRVPKSDNQPLTNEEIEQLRGLKQGGRLVRVLHVQDLHVKKDGCGGSVFVRVHARASMSTFRSDNDVDVYSDIVPL